MMQDGITATNPQTGERLVLQGGQWVPMPSGEPIDAALEQTATNPETGAQMALRDGQWVPLDGSDNGVYATPKHSDVPGLSLDSPIDLGTVDRNVATSLMMGDWVRGKDGTVYQLPSDPLKGDIQEGDREQSDGVYVRPQSGEVVYERPNGGVEDFFRSIPTGLAQGLAGIVGAPDALRGGVHNLADWERDKLGIKPSENPNLIDRAADALRGLPSRIDYPTTGEANQGIQSVTGEYYQPQTVAGEYGRTIGEFAPGAVVPGGLATRAASVVVPAVASESAGQLGRMIDNADQGDQRASGGVAGVITGDTAREEGFKLEPIARLVGGLAGGLGVGGASGLRSGASNVVRNATEGVTPQQLAMAEALSTRSPIPLTTAERLQQVTGGATGLARIQRVVEGSNNRLGPMMAERPAQVERAVGNVMDQIGPQTAPQAVAGQAQEAASGVLNTMRRRVNESAQPSYDRLPGQTLDPADYASLQANPSYVAAEREVMGNPELAAMLNGGPQDLSTVNRVTTQLGQMAEQARPGQMNPTGNNTIASQRDQAAALARQLASDASPDFAMARQTVATGNEAFVDPLKRGPIGAIANQQELQPNLNAQLQRLFPVKANEGSAQETAQALRMMGEVDPTVAPALTRQHLATEANTALRDLSGGPNQFGGAQLAANIAGTGEREAAFLSAVDASAPMASRDTRDLIEALRATGQRERPGSNTSFNNELKDDLRGGNVGQAIAQTLTNPAGVPGRISRAYDDMIARANSNRLAEFLQADPAEATAIINRARNVPRGGNRIRMANALMANQDDQ